MTDTIIYLLIFAGGLLVGIVLTIVITRVYKPYYKQDLASLTGEMQRNLVAFTDTANQSAISRLVEMSEQVITRHTELGDKNLDTKKQLIDQSLKEVRDNLKNVEQLVSTMEKERVQAYGQLGEQIKSASEQTLRLQETTGRLQLALGNARVRGQWGERMADDILQSIGFVEGTNYLKQQTTETAGSRPDYTFLLPNQLRLNMDVKFPLDNYMKFINTDSEAEQESYKAAFLKDARQRIKEVNSRDYINPAEHTVDYVLVLIPNEQVYRFIHENDPAILDEALKNSVVLCSPITLYAVLALIRRALDTFKMERATAEILGLISLFEKHWIKFVESMDKMGKKLQDAQTEYDYLLTTRKSKLEKPVKKIEEIRRERGIEEVKVIEGEVIQIEDSQPEK
jgi:DNA recombination protein RmuC